MNRVARSNVSASGTREKLLERGFSRTRCDVAQRTQAAPQNRLLTAHRDARVAANVSRGVVYQRIDVMCFAGGRGGGGFCSHGGDSPAHSPDRPL